MQRRNVLKALSAGAGLLATLPHITLAAENTTRRHLRMTFTITNPGGDTLQDQRLFLYAPLAHTKTQRVHELHVDAAHHISEDTAGNSLLDIRFAHFPPFGTQVTTLSATLALRVEPARERLKNAGLWLGADPFIETADSDIQALAAQLKQNTPSATAQAIQHWLQDHIVYAGFVADDMGASHALRTRRGDCTEYAYLAVALARLNGIPARVIGGYFSVSDFVAYAGDYHNWAELYFNDAWRVLDAQKGHFDTAYAHYIDFRRVTPRIDNPLQGAHRFRTQGTIHAHLPG